jgi:hypothetical protein
MDYTDRSKLLRTPKQAIFYDKLEKQREEEKCGLSKEDYWDQRVHCHEDVLKYYALYYPAYPEVLAKALANKLTAMAEGVARGTDEGLDFEQRSQQIKEERELTEPDKAFVQAFKKTMNAFGPGQRSPSPKATTTTAGNLTLPLPQLPQEPT